MALPPKQFGVLTLCTLVLCACHVESRRVDLRAVDPPYSDTVITVPVKAHLSDGTVVLFRSGARFTADSVRGDGVRYDLARLDSAAVPGAPLQELVALETFYPGVNAGETVVLSTAATLAGIGVGAAAGAALAVAIFGSCPTVYVDSAGEEVLQAELFSYSIAPLFEMRDVDGLRVQSDAAGRVTVTVRNEALETHYLNQLEVLEVRLAEGQRLMVDERGLPLLLPEASTAAVRATDRSGRDVGPQLERIDGVVPHPSPERFAAALGEDPWNSIELVFPPTTADTVALELRIRNSLLSTVLLYDVMLGSGAAAVEWLGGDLQQIGPATALGRWYSEQTGIRVQVWDGRGWEPLGRVPDSGPIAWEDVAVAMTVPPGDSVRVRLEFLTDAYRIDAVRLADGASRGSARRVPAARVLDAGGHDREDAIIALAAPDAAYLITGPGDRYDVEFQTEPGEERRAYLVTAQGYYTEWVRGDWVRRPRTDQPFEPGRAALRAAYRRWADVRDGFRHEFETRRVPSR